MEPTRLFAIISWILLPTVMFGGYSLLTLKRRNTTWLTSFRGSHFRAGHAHAGVLLALSLLYYTFLAQTGFSKDTKLILCVLFLLGVLAQSGGFFVTVLIGKPGTPSPGYFVTVLGAVVLATAAFLLAYGLMTV
jgi:hypothetical protein